MLASVELSKRLEKSNKVMNRRMNQMYHEFFKLVSKVMPDFQKKFQAELVKQQRDEIEVLDEFIGSMSFDIQRIYYEVLQKYGYRFKDKVLASIDMISSYQDLENVQTLPGISSVDDYFYPWFCIKTMDYIYPFLPIEEVYSDDMEEIRTRHRTLEPGFSNLYSTKYGYQPFALGNLSYACHFATEHFAYLHPEAVAVTALCPHIFENFYWFHSYNQVGDEVVDIANGFVMKKEDFDLLLEPIVLDETLGKDILAKKEKILKTAIPFIRDCINDNPLKGFAYNTFDHYPLEEQEKIRKKIQI